DGENAYAVHRDLQKVMQSLVGIFRTEQDLVTALSELQKLQARGKKVRVEGSRLFNPGWHLSRDLTSMLTLSEAVARSAQARKESRGAHSRIDYPNLDEKVWGKQNNVISRAADGSMQLRQVPTKEMPEELKQVLAEDSAVQQLATSK